MGRQSITVFGGGHEPVGGAEQKRDWEVGGDSDPWQVFAALHREMTHNKGQRPSQEAEGKVRNTFVSL